MNSLLILFSIIISILWYKNADCKRCKLESVLIFILLMQFKNQEILLIKIIAIFLFGELVIRFVSSKK